MNTFHAALYLLLWMVQPANGTDCDELLASTQARIDSDLPLIERETLAREAVRLCGQRSQAHLLLGRVLLQKGALDESVASFKRASQLDSEWAVPLAWMGRAMMLQGQHEAAEIYFGSAEALAHNENDWNAIEQARAIHPHSGSPKEDAYAFKTADEIVLALSVGSKSVRPKNVTTDTTTDTFVGTKGLGVNLSILFDVNSAKLQPEGLGQLDELAKALSLSGRGERYVIEGHSSSEGPVQHNLRLSQSRAERIVDLLTRKYGLDPGRLQFIGRGSENPVIKDGVEVRTLSRRVTILRLYDE